MHRRPRRRLRQPRLTDPRATPARTTTRGDPPAPKGIRAMLDANGRTPPGSCR
ncbi:hypothetical protein SCATT_06170 [Streptantibioticus cattleyicolor NRRL 8057 = DSM 46488]|uniref:Uncharacterized protein n=1 Tax=Streptantibioticus cattleyicolor (strain ATCC 35852 / DSM 46488 / JCM 4925 / NBRC 14057 / NRRL 8057) TaxID=1003195 RepID=G8WTA5_STREN|nr:hypothetical protein SCATT_06170 [Streptantibioticus cattleyicolor NRRL 8057 = DSM 46488]